MQRHRRSIRLRGYDYTGAGAYFVTICTYKRLCLFGDVMDGRMVVNDWGRLVEQEWNQTAVKRRNVQLDAFVVMPNHVHGIIMIFDDDDRSQMQEKGMIHHAPTKNTPLVYQALLENSDRQFTKPIANSLATIIGTFKASVTRKVNSYPGATGEPIWQRNYHDYIIRGEKSLTQIRDYITNNPIRWTEDSLYVDSTKAG